MPPLLGLNLASNLLDLNDDELSWLQRSESNQDVNHAAVDIVLRGRFVVALDEISLLLARTLKCSLDEQILHKGAHIEPDLGPETFVIGLEHNKLGPAVETLFD